MTNLDFGGALALLRQGRRVRRIGWNGKGMWIALIGFNGEQFNGYDIEPCLAMKTAGDKLQPGWIASQPDMLATDWEVLP